MSLIETEPAESVQTSPTPWRFKPGQSGNPAGRPKGSRSKLAEDFLRDILEAWQRGGAEALERVRKDDPSTFLKVVASILPKEVQLDVEHTYVARLPDKSPDPQSWLAEHAPTIEADVTQK